MATRMSAKPIKIKLYWRICGYNSSTPIFEKKVKLGQFTEHQIRHLLMTLTAKAALDYDEIVGAYATRGTKIANDLLAVHKEGWTYSCGSNPYFVASIVDENAKIKPYPELSTILAAAQQRAQQRGYDSPVTGPSQG
jgi:hypothetical protein